MSDLYLLRNALKDMIGLKKVVPAAVLIALPAVIALIWRAAARAGHFQPDVAYNTLSSGLVFGFTLVILSVVFGTGVIAQEVEQKTIVYLLTRPVPRWRIALIKFLAAVVATTATVWIASVLLAVTAYGPGGLVHSRLGRDLLILPVGALAYTALFLLLATLLNRPLLVGLLFAFFWESWVPGLPGNFQKLSLMAYLRVLAPHPKPESATVDITDLLASLNPQTITTRLAWGVLIGVIVCALALALVVFSAREYVPREDTE
ncbi:MAG TPA: ABC transporter permease subunit [Chthonomonadaceae bacterium]|nr:ABC transporter permease subunit [Chthonomonadaceae bacterium]